MSKVLFEQIKERKGIIEVYALPGTDNMGVFVFDKEITDGPSFLGCAESSKPIFTTENGVDVFEGDDFFIVNTSTFEFDEWIEDEESGHSFTAAKSSCKPGLNEKIFSTREAAEKWIEENRPVGLVRGEIYADYDPGDVRIIRVKKNKPGTTIEIYSQFCISSDLGFFGGSDFYNFGKIKPATTEQKKKLIKAEVENDIIWDDKNKCYL